MIKAQQKIPLDGPDQDLFSTLPSKDVCDELVAGYMRTFERVYRVLHIPSFWKEYKDLWRIPAPAKPVPKSFLLKLSLVMAIGAAFLPDSFDFSRSRLRSLIQQWIYAAQWFLTGPNAKSTQNLDGLQVFCLLILVRQTSSLGSSTTLSTASLLSMAMSMGLHRDSRIFSTLSRPEVEMRDRLWTTVVELALQAALESGAPLLPAFSEIDARPPSNLNDINLDSGRESPSRTPLLDGQLTDMSIPILLSKTLLLRIEAVRLLHDFRSEKSYETTVKLASELRLACRNAADFFHSHSSRQAKGEEPPTTMDFQRKYLDMYLRKHILLLHRPFMLKAQKDPRFYLSRKICLESCIVIASYADDLKLPSGKMDDFSSMMVHGSGLLRGALSRDIITTLGLELITQLQEDGAPSRPLISTDPMDKLAHANREPVIRRLEHIRDQLLQVIARGNPSLKGYGFLSALLAQIRAVELGENVKTAVYESIRESMKSCSEVLTAYQAAHTPRDPAAEFAGGPPSFSEGGDFDFEGMVSQTYFRTRHGNI